MNWRVRRTTSGLDDIAIDIINDREGYQNNSKPVQDEQCVSQKQWCNNSSATKRTPN